MTKEMVNHPPHYNHGRFEVIDVIEDWNLSFNLGNTVKYIARADHKGSAVEDLKKARWYLEREIARREKDEQKQDAVPQVTCHGETREERTTTLLMANAIKINNATTKENK